MEKILALSYDILFLMSTSRTDPIRERDHTTGKLFSCRMFKKNSGAPAGYFMT